MQQLYNYRKAVTIGTNIKVDENGWITCEYDNSSGTSTHYENYITNNLKLNVGQNYAVVVEVQEVQGIGTLYLTNRTSSSKRGQFSNISFNFADLSSNTVYVNIKPAQEEIQNKGLGTNIAFTAGQSGKIKFRISVLDDTTITPDNFIYIPYLTIKGNVLGQAGGVGGIGALNVFAQSNEPSKKDGIWINTSYIDSTEYKKLTNIPYAFKNGSVVAIGNDIYLFGSSASGYSKFAYKYNIETYSYKKLADIPSDFYSGSVVAIGNDIYLFGSGASSYGKFAYKYNIETNSYTRINSLIIEFSNGFAAAIGNDIYLFGGRSYPNRLYKYNIETDSYTRLTDIPYTFKQGTASVIGNNIYLFGGDIGYSTPSTFAYKYNIETDSYTRLTDIPYKFYLGSSAAVGNDIYIFGGYDTRNKTYKYNTETNTYTELINMPYEFIQGSSTAIENDIYIFGGSESATNNNYKFEIINLPEIKKFKYDNIIISNTITSAHVLINTIFIKTLNNDFITNLTKNLQLSFENTNLFIDGKKQNYPAYCGDGVRWNKI